MLLRKLARVNFSRRQLGSVPSNGKNYSIKKEELSEKQIEKKEQKLAIVVSKNPNLRIAQKLPKSILANLGRSS